MLLRAVARATAPLLIFARPRGAAPFACAPSGSSLDSWIENTLRLEKRRRSALEKEAEAARSSERLSAWATLVVANLYRIDDQASSAVVEDWENGGKPTTLTFDPTKGTPRQQAEAAFTKARRMRRGSAVVGELVEQSLVREQRLLQWQSQASLLAKGESVDALDALRVQIMREARKLKLKVDGLKELDGVDDVHKESSRGPRGSRADTQQKALFGSNTPGWSGREFTSPHGVPILVGRNRKENEHLSLSICHVRGAPGAHVVLQMSRVKGKELPRDECLQMSADLAAFYSELRDDGKALVTYASPKHVTKPNGAPLGAVKLRKEGGTIVGRPSSDLIPDEVKALRERERFGGGSGPVQSGGGAKKWT